MHPVKNIVALFIGLSFIAFVPAMAQDETVEEALPAVLLADLAADADLIALVRVLDTDYEYTREFPSGGTAFLKILIPYKVSRPLEDIIYVYEEGLHPGECYFKNPTVLEEGRRHLVFLKFSEDVKDQYNGLETGCKLEVLVNNNDSYAVRYPVNGIKLADDLSGHARPMIFADPYALLEDEDITPTERNVLLESAYLSALENQYRYTHGIDISAIRQLMGPEGLTLDRSLK